MLGFGIWGPPSNGSMTEPTVLTEVMVAGGVIPMFEIPKWREEFGVVAGVTGRGAEASDFDLGLASDDPTRVVLERWHRVERAFERFPALVIGRQVHGTNLRWHAGTVGWTVVNGVDGHGTRERGILLAVSLADCIPVYLVDPVARAIALLHSGWKGTAAGILQAGVGLLAERAGSRVEDLVVHCGVGICGRCYQVGADVAGACGRPVNGGGRANLDLRGVILDQAAAQGVRRRSVSSHCSAHMRDRFFSHRGSGGTDGRMVAFLGIEP